jgi:hypothetical protein
MSFSLGLLCFVLGSAVAAFCLFAVPSHGAAHGEAAHDDHAHGGDAHGHGGH